MNRKKKDRNPTAQVTLQGHDMLLKLVPQQWNLLPTSSGEDAQVSEVDLELELTIVHYSGGMKKILKIGWYKYLNPVKQVTISHRSPL